MPETTLKVTSGRSVTLDARPDRPDLRDRPYLPRLKSLPAAHPPTSWISLYFEEYRKAGLILNQGTEGACTGFGLAAVVNFLLFSEAAKAAAGGPIALPLPPPTSPRMLYHLARLYDEWPGEDYDGSSCRGAMKGWFHHGVCAETLWPYVPPGAKEPAYVPPSDGWDTDAAGRPLGAYYRVTHDSVADMQSAIHEVGAVYVSADVHDGWSSANLTAAPGETASLANVPTILWTEGMPIRGGHAFAIVGYDSEGFIVQNSWGQSWGYQGFARMIYDDWLENGSDAWVAVMGAPVSGRAPSAILSSRRTVSHLTPQLARGLVNGATAEAVGHAPSGLALDADSITRHVIALGPGGRPVQLRIEAPGAAASVRDVAFTWPKQHFDTVPAGRPKRVAIYLHGGLNDLSAGLARAKIMAPAFLGNEVYPIFVAWQSGVLDAIKDLLGINFDREIRPNKNIFKNVIEGITDVSDRGLELLTTLPATGIWDALKNRATGASEAEGGVRALIAGLTELKAAHPAVEIHAVAHSAWAILLGASFAPLIRAKLTYSTLSLYAPACTVAFANQTFVAKAGKAFQLKDMHVDLLSNGNELDDTVGPYAKSLLYYVSRACERRKTPLLGLEAVWDKSFDKDDLFIDSSAGVNPDVARWRAGSKGVGLSVLAAKSVVTNIGTGATVGAVHGCFDNWIDGVSNTLKRIRGGGALPRPIQSLQGF